MTSPDDPNLKTPDAAHSDKDNEQGLLFEHEFAQAVERGRLKRGWTAEEAARRAGVSAKTWQRVEDGKPARLSTYFKIDGAFGHHPGAAFDHFSRYGHLRDLYSDTRAQPEASTEATVPQDERSHSLLDRIADLGPTELRRLRDMVDAAIAASERPFLERRRAELAAMRANIHHQIEATRALLSSLRTDETGGTDVRQMQSLIDHLHAEEGAIRAELERVSDEVKRAYHWESHDGER